MASLTALKRCKTLQFYMLMHRGALMYGTKAPSNTDKPKTETKPKSPGTTVPLTDNTQYQTPEYYAHDNWSFYDIESSIAGRVPQPNSKEKQKPAN